MADMKQSRPYFGLGFRLKVLKTFELVPSFLGSGWEEKAHAMTRGMRVRVSWLTHVVLAPVVYSCTGRCTVAVVSVQVQC